MPGPKRNLTPEQEALIAQRYAGGETVPDIARDLGLPPTSVRRSIARQGGEFRGGPTTRRLTEEERATIVKLSVTTHSSTIADSLGVAPATVGRALREAGVKVPRKRRSCTLNENAFDVLTPEAAYWCGFLFADGCLPRDQHGTQALSVNLAEKDRGHLEKLRSFLGSDHAITRITTVRLIGGPTVYYKVRSKHISDRLLALGMTKKTDDRAPCSELANSRDFWRGMIDGDGTVSRSEAVYASIILHGHMPVLVAFQTWLSNQDLAEPHIAPASNGSALTPRKQPIFRISAMGDKACGIIDTLYRNATIALDRKRIIAEQIFAAAPTRALNLAK
jgi:transposase-like protein